MIRHKHVLHEGGHEAIVEQELFDAVQTMLAGQAPRKRAAVAGRFERAALAGRLFDASGEKMTPCFSRGSKGTHYRYYVSASLQRGMPAVQADMLRRIAATDIERLVTSLVNRWLPDAATPLTILQAVRLSREGIAIDLPVNLAADIEGELGPDDTIVSHTPQRLQVHHTIALPLRGGRARVASGAMPARPDPYLIGALRKAHAMLDRDRGRPIIAEAPAAQHDRKLLRLALLAPDIQHAILVGRQPASLHLERLRRIDLPLDWGEQRRMLGFVARG